MPAELNTAQERAVEHLDITLSDMIGAVRRALLVNGIKPTDKEARGIVGELGKLRNATVQEMMKDRSPEKKMRDYS